MLRNNIRMEGLKEHDSVLTGSLNRHLGWDHMACSVVDGHKQLLWDGKRIPDLTLRTAFYLSYYLLEQ